MKKEDLQKENGRLEDQVERLQQVEKKKREILTSILTGIPLEGSYRTNERIFSWEEITNEIGKLQARNDYADCINRLDEVENLLNRTASRLEEVYPT